MAGPIVKFKAGRVLYDESSKLCTPQLRKGEITVQPSEEGEDFYDFKWTAIDKTASDEVNEEVLLVIPGDVSWNRVKSCKTGRVYSLKFYSSGAKSLFWMQEPNGDDDDLSAESAKDKEIFNKLNELFSEPDDE